MSSPRKHTALRAAALAAHLLVAPQDIKDGVLRGQQGPLLSQGEPWHQSTGLVVALGSLVGQPRHRVGLLAVGTDGTLSPGLASPHARQGKASRAPPPLLRLHSCLIWLLLFPSLCAGHAEPPATQHISCS